MKSSIQQPMAVVILGGVVTSTFLTMIVIPALFLNMAAPERVKQLANTLKAKSSHPQEISGPSRAALRLRREITDEAGQRFVASWRVFRQLLLSQLKLLPWQRLSNFVLMTREL